MPRWNTPPAYRHHKASGKAVVRLNGKDFYLGPYGSQTSKDEYDRRITEWLAAGRRLPAALADDDLLVSELAVAYVNAGEMTKSHASGIRAMIRLWVRLYGPTPAASFGPLALKVIREKLVEKGMKRKTVNARVDQLRRIFRWGVGQELVAPATLQALEAVEGLKRGKTAAPESVKVKGVSLDHVEACVNAMPPMLAAMVRVQLLTGMRAAELTQLRTGDLNMSGTVWTYTPGSHKTEHHGLIREVEFGPKAIEVLRPWLKPDLTAYVFSPAAAEAARRAARTAARTTPAGPGRNAPGTNRKAAPRRTPGDRYDTNAYRRAIKYAIDRKFPPPDDLLKRKGEKLAAWKARLGPEKWAAYMADRKLVRWTPHRIRHTFGQLVRDRFGLEHAQRALGHANAKTTEHYAEAAKSKAVEVARLMG